MHFIHKRKNTELSLIFLNSIHLLPNISGFHDGLVKYEESDILLQPDCHDVPSYGYTEDGPYEVQPTGAAEPFFIYCEFDVDGTAWTLLQRRVNGFTSFNRTWQEYQQGFGVPGPASNYWSVPVHYYSNSMYSN